LKADVHDLRERADHQRLGQARHAFEQAMPAREDGREKLLDDLVLADDHLVQLFGHELAAAGELLQHFAKIAALFERVNSFGPRMRGRHELACVLRCEAEAEVQKSEARNPKQIQSTKDQMTKDVLVINLFWSFWICFGFRISCFGLISFYGPPSTP